MEEKEEHKKAPFERHSSPVPMRTLDPPITLVDRAKEIESASNSLQTHLNGKLDVILGQIRSLQSEAKVILERANRDLELHKIKCSFEKKIGQAMYLYEKEDGNRYFSMLSPKEWGNPPHKFIGGFVLQADQSFRELEEAEA